MCSLEWLAPTQKGNWQKLTWAAFNNCDLMTNYELTEWLTLISFVCFFRLVSVVSLCIPCRRTDLIYHLNVSFHAGWVHTWQINQKNQSESEDGSARFVFISRGVTTFLTMSSTWTNEWNERTILGHPLADWLAASLGNSLAAKLDDKRRRWPTSSSSNFNTWQSMAGAGSLSVSSLSAFTTHLYVCFLSVAPFTFGCTRRKDLVGYICLFVCPFGLTENFDTTWGLRYPLATPMCKFNLWNRCGCGGRRGRGSKDFGTAATRKKKINVVIVLPTLWGVLTTIKKFVVTYSFSRCDGVRGISHMNAIFHDGLPGNKASQNPHTTTRGFWGSHPEGDQLTGKSRGSSSVHWV